MQERVDSFKIYHISGSSRRNLSRWILYLHCKTAYSKTVHDENNEHIPFSRHKTSVPSRYVNDDALADDFADPERPRDYHFLDLIIVFSNNIIEFI